MTVTAPSAPVSVTMILAMLDEAKHPRYRYESGVIGLLARPDRDASQDLEHDGQLVRVRPAESALAVREALLEHREGDWMVILTDRSDDDLGAGVLSHLVWNRLRRPDPWEAVRTRFKATGIDPALTGPGSRELATALLAATPEGGWPAAPAGVLTRSHALSSVARRHLDLDGEVTDVITVLGWSALPAATSRVADLRADFGDVLTDATLDWVASATGVAAAPVRALMSRGEIGEMVPLGLAVHLLTNDGPLHPEERHVATMGLVRLEPHWGLPVPSTAALTAFGSAATAVLTDLTRAERNAAHVNRLLQRADAILEQTQASQLAIHSELLPRSFRTRLTLLAEALRRAVADLGSGGPTQDANQSVESRWEFARQHRLGRTTSPEVDAFGAAVRLWRWLQTPESPPDASLAQRARRHLDEDAWADAAINDAVTGVDEPALSDALRLVVEAAMSRRDRSERAFAQSLAAATARDDGAEHGGLDGDAGQVWFLESLLPRVVLPMARKVPVLLLILDGMSAAAATEIVEDTCERLGWVEAAVSGSATRRSAALAVLPSITEVSRASMLCGRLTWGGQDLERKGYEELTQRSAKIRGALFHKKGVDSTTPGALVAEGVGAAIDGRDGLPLVTVVLNTVDDALDRSDPGGTVWNTGAVKHLEPLLARARAAGRTVIITSDHGHVIERRMGVQRSAPDLTSGRSRGVAGHVEPDEVEVAGRRVLTPESRAVLAVSEGLRYGPLKAGYHGGASAAEVVVPVAVLLPDEHTNDSSLPLLSPQAPAWWSMPTAATAAAPGSPTARSEPGGIRPRPTKRKGAAPGPTLFDELAPAETIPAAQREEPSTGRSVVASGTYTSQRGMTGRLRITDAQVAALIDALVAAPEARLPKPVVASALGLPEFRLVGALSQIQQLLNIEGFGVLRMDVDGQTVVLDERLLRDQFELR
ncbi:MAG: BREX-2 system phosphatase PglZ [Micrococcales bacterium]|nr:BREX-2 system phosphatase PglZ [Micrococcales bacterium]